LVVVAALAICLVLFLGVLAFAVEDGAEEAAPASSGMTPGLGLLAIGAGLAVGLAAIGTGIAQSRIGAAGVGAIAEKPEVTGLVLILVAIPETMVILGFVVAAMLMFTLKG
jgi:V/A-type H+-transporting ATPase subunit K